MPKSKPTQVIVHRIELQDTEREMAEALVASKTINNIANSINGLVAAAGITAVGYLGVKWWAQQQGNEDASLWDLANNPDKLKKLAEEEGLWGGLWKVVTTPAFKLGDLF